MPRNLRIAHDGAIYHVMNRGDPQEKTGRGESGDSQRQGGQAQGLRGADWIGTSAHGEGAGGLWAAGARGFKNSEIG